MSNTPNGTFASTSPCTCPPIVTRTTSVTLLYTMTDESGSASTTTTTTTSSLRQDRELSEGKSTPVAREDPTGVALLSEAVEEQPTGHAPVPIASQPNLISNTTLPSVETPAPAPVPIVTAPAELAPTSTPDASPEPESSNVEVPPPQSSNVEVPAPESSIVAAPEPAPETSSPLPDPTTAPIVTQTPTPIATLETTLSSISNSTTSATFLTAPSAPIDTPVFALPNGPEPTQEPAPTTKEAVETTPQTTQHVSTPTKEATSSEVDQDATAIVPIDGGVSSIIEAPPVMISATQTLEDEIETTSIAETSQIDTLTSQGVSTSELYFGEPTRIPQQSITMTTLLRDTSPTPAIGGRPAGEHAGPSDRVEKPTSASDHTGSESSSDPNLQVVGHDSDNTPSTPVLVGSVVGALTGVAMIAFLFWLWRRKAVKRGRRESLLTPLSIPPEGGDREKSAFPRFHGTPSLRSNERPVIRVLRMEDNQYDQDNQVVRLSTGSNPFLDGHAALNREPTIPVIPPKSPHRNPFADPNASHSHSTIPPPSPLSPVYPYAPAPYVTNLEASDQHHPNLAPAPYVTNLETPPKRKSGPMRPKTRPPSINTNANFRVIYRTPSQEARSFEQHRKNIRSDQFDLEPEDAHISNGSYNIYPMPLNVPSAYPPPPSHSDRVSWDCSSSIYSTDVSVIVGWEGDDPAVPVSLRPGPPGVFESVAQLRNGGGPDDHSPNVGKAQ